MQCQKGLKRFHCVPIDQPCANVVRGRIKNYPKGQAIGAMIRDAKVRVLSAKDSVHMFNKL